MKLVLISEEQLKVGANWNALKPPGVPPLPSSLANVAIEDVYWEAPGREEDPSVGAQISGVRKSSSGYVYNGWWYYKKFIHRAGDPIKVRGQVEGFAQKDMGYFYRKRRTKSLTGESEVVEEYIGKDLIDPDTGMKINVPEIIRHSEDFEDERS